MRSHNQHQRWHSVITWCILIVSAALLAGCAIEPQRVVVTKKEVTVIKSPELLLMPCAVTSPPDRQEYVKRSPSKQKNMLTNYSINLLGDLDKCNKQIQDIKDFQIQEETILKQNERRN